MKYILVIALLTLSQASHASNTKDLYIDGGRLNLELLCDYVRSEVMLKVEAKILLRRQVEQDGTLDIQIDEICEL